jgi:uncharacterized protein YndB with AHSA1/START domain
MARTLVLRRTFQAPATKVFAALLSAEAIKQWWSLEGFAVVAVEVDARVGGRYSLVLHSLTEAWVVYEHGIYREITPPTKVVFTHVCDARSTYPALAAVGMADVETLVTVELHAYGDATELVLTHEFLPTSAAEEMYRGGWKGVFEKLGRYLERVG